MKKKIKIPKNIEILSNLASYLSSEMSYGDSINITPLAKALESNGKCPHHDTIQNKLNDGFILRDVLNSFKPIYKGGKLIRIEKIMPMEANNETIKAILLKIQENTENAKKDINLLKIDMGELKGVKG
jgi:hypothetical protein